MRFALLALAVLALTACKAQEEPARTTEAVALADPLVSERTKFIAADVFEVEGVTFRLANVLVPQPYPKAKCWAEAALARRALRFVEALEWGPWALVTRENLTAVGADPDGLTRATVNMGQSDERGDPLLDDLGARLVSAGLAAKWTPQGFDWCGAPPDPAQAGAPVLSGLS